MSQLGPLIEKLGLPRDAAIESPMIDHAIERAQNRAG
jgi:preprotein translocase subunit SecA